MNPIANPEYLNTVFEFIPEGKPGDFWVVTAYNPGGKPADPGDNLEADARLLDEIHELKITRFRVIGLSADASHAEPGWGIACDENTAIGLGRRYKQQALFHFHAARIDLVDCRTHKRKALANPATRILDPRTLRHFSLFVGSPENGRRIDPIEYAGIGTRIGALFPGFTIQRAEGGFESRFEDTLVIHIATREPTKVVEAAHSIRSFLNQKGVGISHNGVYQRVRDWSDTELILEAFGLKNT